MTPQKIRLDKGLSQEQMAKHCGVTSRTIRNWEHGRTEMPMGMIEHMKKARKK